MADDALTDSELGGEVDLLKRSGRVKRSNFGDETLGQLGHAVPCSAQHKFGTDSRVVVVSAAKQPLGLGVTHVVGGGPEEQMSGVTADFNVTTMEHEERPRIFPVPKKISDPVCAEGMPSWIKTEVPIASGSVAHPRPAGIRPTTFVHFRPETLGVLSIKFGHRFRIVASHSASYSGRLGQGRAVLNTPHGSLNYATEVAP